MASSHHAVILAAGAAPFSAQPGGHSAFDLAAIAMAALRSAENGGGAPDAIIYAGPHAQTTVDLETATILSAHLGFPDIPIIPIVGAEGSASWALTTALALLRGQQRSRVLVLGVTRVMHLLHDSAKGPDLAAEFVRRLVLPAGLHDAFPSWLTPFSLVGSQFWEAHGLSFNLLRQVMLKARRVGKANPLVAMKMNLDEQQAKRADAISGPLTHLDVAPISDGAVALLLGSSDLADGQRPVQLTSPEYAHSVPHQPLQKYDSTQGCFPATRRAATKLTESLGVKDLDAACDLLEVDDRLSMLEPVALCDLGVTTGGEVASWIADHGDRVNNSGGYLSLGFGGAAHGLGKVFELFLQLSGNAGERQIEGVSTGLFHEVTGLGSSAAATFLSNDPSKLK